LFPSLPHPKSIDRPTNPFYRRSKNERFYLSGHLLVDLIERSASAKKRSSSSSSSSNRRAPAAAGQLDAATAALLRESTNLRQTLVSTYAGERLRRILDWTLSCIDDDVSSFTHRLTALEMRLFRRAAGAAAAHARWRAGGGRRIAVSAMALRSAAMGRRAVWLQAAAGNVAGGQTTPGAAGEEEDDGRDRHGRRRAITPDGMNGGGKRMRVA